MGINTFPTNNAVNPSMMSKQDQHMTLFTIQMDQSILFKVTYEKSPEGIRYNCFEM